MDIKEIAQRFEGMSAEDIARAPAVLRGVALVQELDALMRDHDLTYNQLREAAGLPVRGAVRGRKKGSGK